MLEGTRQKLLAEVQFQLSIAFDTLERCRLQCREEVEQKIADLEMQEKQLLRSGRPLTLAAKADLACANCHKKTSDGGRAVHGHIYCDRCYIYATAVCRTCRSRLILVGGEIAVYPGRRCGSCWSVHCDVDGAAASEV